MIRHVLAALLLLASCATSVSKSEPRRPRVTRPLQMDAFIPTQRDTEMALQIIDSRLKAAGLPAAGNYAHVVWFPAAVVETTALPGILLGFSEPAMRVGGMYCDIYSATNLQPQPSQTSLAHELLHCAMGVSGDLLSGDPEHTRPEWNSCKRDPRPGCGWIDETNAVLAMVGL